MPSARVERIQSGNSLWEVIRKRPNLGSQCFTIKASIVGRITKNIIIQNTCLSTSFRDNTSMFWHDMCPPAALDWPPKHIFKIEKTLNDIFKRNLDFWKKKNIFLIIYLRFYDEKLFFNLGISLKRLFSDGFLWPSGIYHFALFLEFTVPKLKNSNGDKTAKDKLWQNSKSLIVTKP